MGRRGSGGRVGRGGHGRHVLFLVCRRHGLMHVAVFVRDTVELPAVVAELEAAVVCMEGTA